MACSRADHRSFRTAVPLREPYARAGGCLRDFPRSSGWTYLSDPVGTIVDVPPEWLRELAGALAEHLVAAALPAPLGAHVQHTTDAEAPQGVWELSIFYGKTDVVGGPQDGLQTDTPFWLDLAGVLKAFNRLDAIFWQSASLGPNDDLGPHVAIEGEYRGQAVRVRVLAAAPPQFPAARSADTIRGTFLDLW
jgi:hypothetical protein